MENLRQFETLTGLVEQYSPSGQETGAVAWLVKRMQKLGFTQSFVDKTGNAVGMMGTGEKQIVLLGHIDTVPGEIEVRLTPQDKVIARNAVTKQSPPDDERLPSRLSASRDDVLFGRGSVDAKGPLAAFVDAVAAVGPVDGWQFLVMGAIDEERDSVGARGIVDQYQPDYAIIGEPSQWDRVTLGYKGSAWAEVTARQTVAHTAGQAESAPEVAVNFWNQVVAWGAEFNAGRERAFDQVLPTLRGFSSGGDGFEETATLKLGVRLPLDLDPPEWYQQLRELGSAKGLEISPTGFPISAYRAERNTLLVRAFLGGIRAMDGKPGFVVKTGTADLNIVAPVWKCPAVAYGPGDSSLDHTPDEHILLGEYKKAVSVLVEVLGRLSSS
jgi:LysW-gamma-L-lysine carboxypeptidase